MLLEVGSRSGRYGVHMEPGVAARLGALLDAARVPSRRFVVSNTTIWRFHEPVFAGTSSEDPILLPDGERYKTLQTVGRIYDALIRARADRASAIIAVGGGVLGDTAGFAAATYLRGIPVVQVPTTLLAQVDSALGGKVGVNHQQGKNLIGAFHPPAAVVIDPTLLATLPRREFRAGLYEVIKYGVIASPSLFERVAATLPALFKRDPDALMPVVTESCEIKARIVEQDEHETGVRRTLKGVHLAFTGVLTRKRAEAVRAARRAGAIIHGMPSVRTTVVVRGRPNPLQAAGRDSGRKLIEIKRLREKGHRITLLNETQFWRLVARR